MKNEKNGKDYNDSELMIIPKQKVLDLLKEKGIDVKQTLEDFTNYFHNGRSLDEKKYELGKVSETSYKIKCNGYTIMQSNQKTEAPINIIIPKDELRKIADKSFSYNGQIPTYDELVKVPEKESIKDKVSEKTLDMLREKGILTGNLVLESMNGGNIKKPAKDDIIYATVDGKKHVLAKYLINPPGWYEFSEDIKIGKINKQPTKTLRLPGYIAKAILQNDITITTRYHKPVKFDDYISLINKPFDGMTVTINNPLNSNNTIHMKYVDNIGSYVARGLSENDIERFRDDAGVPVISETEYNIYSGFAERILDEVNKNKKAHGYRNVPDLAFNDVWNKINSPEYISSAYKSGESALNEAPKKQIEMIKGCIENYCNKEGLSITSRMKIDDYILVFHKAKIEAERQIKELSCVREGR